MIKHPLIASFQRFADGRCAKDSNALWPDLGRPLDVDLLLVERLLLVPGFSSEQRDWPDNDLEAHEKRARYHHQRKPDDNKLDETKEHCNGRAFSSRTKCPPDQSRNHQKRNHKDTCNLIFKLFHMGVETRKFGIRMTKTDGRRAAYGRIRRSASGSV